MSSPAPSDSTVHAPVYADSTSSKPRSAKPSSLKHYDYPDLHAPRRRGPLGHYLLQASFGLALLAIPVALALHLDATMTQNLMNNQNTTAPTWYTWLHAVIVFCTNFFLEAKSNVYLLTVLSTCVIVFAVIMIRREKPVYLQDFAITIPPDSLKCNKETFVNTTIAKGIYPEETCDFQKRLIERSGLGDETYLPKGCTHLPPIATVEYAREECVTCFTSAFDQLFERTGLSPKDIDALIVTCSIFNPTPSISAMIVNHYHMRNDCQTFNIGGMGCSAGIIGLELASNLLRHSKRGFKVAVFCHENITLNAYSGIEKAMLLPNMLFRMNGAAILLTNTYNYFKPPKYELTQIVRVYNSADEAAHKAIYQQTDEQGHVGVALSKDLVAHVTKAMFKNFFYVGRKMLPLRVKIAYIFDAFLRKISKKYAETHGPMIPDFQLAFKHFCIHCGGRAIIDGLQKNLNLTDETCEPSRAALYRFGNTSSASLWYELNYIELSGKQKAGDYVLQLTFGSGLKVNSAVWKTL